MPDRDPGSVRFRRSPHLVCYWSGGTFVLENYATGARGGAHPLTCDVLDFFSDWRSATALFRHKPAVPAAQLRSLVQVLVRRTFLQQEGAPIAASERAMATWSAWNPAAGFFHHATRDVPYMETEAADAMLDRRGRGAKPDSIKRYPNARHVRLPDVRVPTGSSEFVDVLRARRTWRRFAPMPVPIESLGTALKLAAGVERWAIVPGEGRVPLKTSPSGGARHPIEAYVLALDISGLERGLYHYAADRHGLDRLTSGAPPQPGRAISADAVVVPPGRRARAADGRPSAQPVALRLRARLPRGVRRGGTRVPDVLPGGDVARSGAVLFDGARRFAHRGGSRDRRNHGIGGLPGGCGRAAPGHDVGAVARRPSAAADESSLESVQATIARRAPHALTGAATSGGVYRKAPANRSFSAAGIPQVSDPTTDPIHDVLAIPLDEHTRSVSQFREGRQDSGFFFAQLEDPGLGGQPLAEPAEQRGRRPWEHSHRSL